MIKVLIIDDEYPARLRVKKLLADYSDQVHLLGEADCGREAIELIEQHRPDAIFLDIQMPDMSGFEVLRQLSYQPMVIFTTAFTQYAIKAFDTLSVDYLVKPLTVERFKMAVEKLTKFSSLPPSPDYKKLEALIQELTPVRPSFSLPIKKRDRIILVDYEQISHFKAEDKYVSVVLNEGKTHLINKSIGQLAEELPPEFIRVHRSYIVNRTYIYEIEKYFKGRFILKLRDKNQSTITSGETYLGRLKEQLGV